MQWAAAAFANCAASARRSPRQSPARNPPQKQSPAPVFGPIALGLLLISYVAVKRLEDGVPIWRVPLDFKFLSAFMYTGALLAIYLSYYNFFIQVQAR